ncbi:unnamed protein product [Hermetia illucens]|uniref:G-patch domain-containing protein n=1 Tax=Hermetia illucens TaxID=343691 RepID=A0A7R8UB53_HERIL|nr:PIN2/TERF1-interacting telomerase inhibitor 1 isoform X2 [Hermetia illucens]CAD7076684.1 unnamed protein product [Hermetia illucens]
MAMLAERRERKRYNLVPRGKALYEDDNRFGTRMLEKMGWKKGNGLGARQDGEKEFIRIRYKNDNEGLGFEDRNDQWTQHETEFDGLLKTLSNGGDADEGSRSADEETPATVGFGFSKDSDTPKKPIITGESLEEKSKKSRARVHYKKFTRGKDISQYSEKDLANIFGRKSLIKDESEKAPEEDDQKQSNNASQATSDSEENKEANFGVVTISSGTSINDYFKAKMAAFRQKFTTSVNSEGLQDDKVVNDCDYGEQEKSSKKTKKRKHRDESESNEAQEYNGQGSNDGEVLVADESGKTKKKSKKRKRDKEAVDDDLAKSHDSAPQTENPAIIEGEISERKRKLKHPEQTSQEGECIPEDQVVPEAGKKKKSKKRDKNACENQDDTLMEVAPAAVGHEVEVASKRKSKKAKHLSEVELAPEAEYSMLNGKSEAEQDPNQQGENSAPNENSEVDAKKEKKKSKNKRKSPVEENDPIEIETELADTQRKKKKSKKSCKEDNLDRPSEECAINIPQVPEVSGKDQDLCEERVHKKLKKSKKEKQISSEEPTPIVINDADGLVTEKVKKSKKSKRKTEEPDSSNDTNISTSDATISVPPAGSNETLTSQSAKKTSPLPPQSIETQQS